MPLKPGPITRRAAGKLIAAIPGAAALAPWASPALAEDKACSQVDVIAAQEPGLSPEERAHLKKAVGEGEKALATIRDFKLAGDVGPASKFRALKSRRP